MSSISAEDMEKLLTSLVELNGHYSELKGNRQWFIANKLVAWVTGGKRQIHNAKPGWFFLHSIERNKVFRLATDFQQATQNIFEIDHGFSIKNKSTKPYRPTAEATTLVMDLIKQGTEKTKPLIDSLGRNVNSPGKAITSRDSNNKKRICKPNLPSLQTINRDNVTSLLDHAQSERRKVADGGQSNLVSQPTTQEQILSLDRLIQSSVWTLYHSRYDGYGDKMPLKYVESSMGRLNGLGFHLQNAPRIVKAAALHGQIDYDIVNCHITLAAQLGHAEGLNTDSLDWYIGVKSDKPKFNRLAQHFEVSPDELKQAMLALIYGASINQYAEGAISAIFQENKIDFLNHLEIKGFIKEVVDIRRAVVANTKQKNGFIVNRLGKQISLHEDENTQFAHVLHGYEATMLHIALEQCSDKITLLSHDGFAANDSINTQLIESEYHNRTGLKIALEAEPINYRFANS